MGLYVVGAGNGVESQESLGDMYFSDGLMRNTSPEQGY